MGVLGKLNETFGYSEEKMNQVLGTLPKDLNVSVRYPVAVSFKMRVSLFATRVYASGYAALIGNRRLLVYRSVPLKGAALYDCSEPKKLVIKDTVAGQRVIEGKLLNLTSREVEEVILQIAPKVPAFPHQEENAELFLAALDQFRTK